MSVSNANNTQNRKAKLRRNDDPVALGKQYDGARVSRDALGADSDDDPFAARSNDDSSASGSGEDEDEDGEEEDSDDVSGFDSDDSAIDEDALAQDDSDEDEEGEEDDESEDADEDLPRKKSNKKSPAVKHSDATGDREEIRRLMATDQKTIAATISSAAKADAIKGKAVKQQRTTFDALLNARIKLQSGLTSLNGISAVLGSNTETGENSTDQEEVDEEAIKAAESAAMTLWSTLEGLRTALADATAKEGSKKRKRPSPVSLSTPTASLWERMNEVESDSLPHRRSILDKWSSKVRGASAALPNTSGKLLGSAGRQQTITTVLDAQVASEIGERPSKRSRPDQHESFYDDSTFYQSLLRDLVEQRMAGSDGATSGFDNLHQLPTRLPIHPVTGMRNDKVKREIDTRASKGRKMKYTVHEKLQNFMAPEDRGSWSTRARDELFVSLLGRSASGLLGEGDESGSDEDDEVDREEGGLRLFRN